MRKEFMLEQSDYDYLISACKSVPYMIIGGRAPQSPQENANRAWKHLGGKLGFDYMTVQPVQGKGSLYFTAEEKEGGV